ncbi:MAG TPA: NmrA/HSCARG family protein [Longimicrobiaceae bacterium]|nr:NmrA/HSCARG family protein [Longimicrobiaceae bacterium]
MTDSHSANGADPRPLILVTGATGAQGGSVARFLLQRGHFAVRALTRNPGSPAAQALAAAGAEVVQGDLGDPASLKAAVAGCYGVFGLTNFWEHFGGELEHGNNLIDAVAAAGVQHFVLSTLPSYHGLSGGELSVPHCDMKAVLESRTRELGLPATFVHVAFYYENFATYFPPQRQEDGSYAFGFPQGDTPLAAVSVEDVGGVVARIFEQRDRFLGQKVGVVGDDLPVAAYAESMSRGTGRRTVYSHVPREVFASYGFPGAEELANMFETQRRFIPQRTADVAISRELHPGVRTFDAWMSAEGAALLAN